MGDTIDDFKALRTFNKALRAHFGVDCPGCRKKQPRRIPTRLLPGQRCRVCGYRDNRPDLTDEQVRRLP